MNTKNLLKTEQQLTLVYIMYFTNHKSLHTEISKHCLCDTQDLYDKVNFIYKSVLEDITNNEIHAYRYKENYDNN